MGLSVCLSICLSVYIHGRVWMSLSYDTSTHPSTLSHNPPPKKTAPLHPSSTHHNPPITPPP